MQMYYNTPCMHSEDTAVLFITTAAQSAAALSLTPLWQQLYARYSHYPTQIDIARQFIDWSKNQADGGGLLLPAQQNTEYYFVGDLHGQFTTLLSIICQAVAESALHGRHPHLIILGDCIDRGEEDFATVALIQESIMGEQHLHFTVSYLCGNHDFAVDVNPQGFFYSAVAPADTAIHLNALSKQGRGADALLLGKSIIELARTAPYMGELVWGTPLQQSFIFAHACTPHIDMQQELLLWYTGCNITMPYTALPDHLLYPCRDDFVRGMLHPQIAHAEPNRGFSATKQGTADMETYTTLHHTLTGRRIMGMFRGHDHIANGHRITPLSSGFICTLNALGAGNTTVAAWHLQQKEAVRLITL